MCNKYSLKEQHESRDLVTCSADVALIINNLKSIEII